jgi:putative ABC transport system permease protein
MLTMLGIVIGVAAVIVVMAVGAGAKQQVVERLQSLGANLLIVLPGSAREAGALLGHGSKRSLTEDDADAIGRELPQVVAAAPVVFKQTQVVSGNRNWATSVYGVTQAFFLAREWAVDAGRPFSPDEWKTAAKVALLGVTAGRELFGNRDPVGEIVRIEHTPFRVIGVLAEKGQSPTGQDQDDKVMVPLPAARIRVLGAASDSLRSVRYLLIKVRTAGQMAETRQAVARLLRQRHGLRPDQSDDFAVRDIADIQQTREQAAGVLGFWLTVVAAVSLLVGGIGIMNIMLVTVTERTREIGLRRAVGAAPRDIRNQFLVEAIVLALLGGSVGVLVGLGTVLAIAALSDLPLLIHPWSVLFAAGSAAVTGVFFGVYPAWRAARLDPIRALRFE